MWSGLGGGRWCHQQCDICRKTAPLLPRAPTHLLSPPLHPPPSPLCPGAVPALIKTSFSPLPPSILLALALSQNSVRLKLHSPSPTFPGCTALRFQSTFCLHCNRPNLVPSGGFKGEACHFSSVKIQFNVQV